MADLEMVVGNTDPPVRATLLDGEGQPANLNGVIQIRWIMRPIRGSAPKINDAAVIDDPNLATVHYDWTDSGVDEAGGYYANWLATFANGRTETFPTDRFLTVAFHENLALIVDPPPAAPLPLLASTLSFAEFRGRDHDPADVQAIRALEDASADIRSALRQTITLVEDDAVELRGTWGRELWLPERPVSAVSDVSIRFEGLDFPLAPAWYEWHDRGLLRLRSWWYWVGMPQLGDSGMYWGGPNASVSLTYTHGYAQVPDDIAAVVLRRAARQVSNPLGASSESFPEGRAIAGATGLTEDEVRLQAKYQPWEYAT